MWHWLACCPRNSYGRGYHEMRRAYCTYNCGSSAHIHPRRGPVNLLRPIGGFGTWLVPMTIGQLNISLVWSRATVPVNIHERTVVTKRCFQSLFFLCQVTFPVEQDIRWSFEILPTWMRKLGQCVFFFFSRHSYVYIIITIIHCKCVCTRWQW